MHLKTPRPRGLPRPPVPKAPRHSSTQACATAPACRLVYVRLVMSRCLFSRMFRIASLLTRAKARGKRDYKALIGLRRLSRSSFAGTTGLQNFLWDFRQTPSYGNCWVVHGRAPQSVPCQSPLIVFSPQNNDLLGSRNLPSGSFRVVDSGRKWRSHALPPQPLSFLEEKGAPSASPVFSCGSFRGSVRNLHGVADIRPDI